METRELQNLSRYLIREDGIVISFRTSEGLLKKQKDKYETHCI